VSSLKTLKINNVLWLPQIAPQISEFAIGMKSPVICYESLFTYFQQAVQYGGALREFWVVFDEDKPVGFAHWYVNQLPQVSMVTCDFTHMWGKYKTVSNEIMAEYVKFGKRNNCLYYKFQALDEKRFKFFDTLCKKQGIDLQRQDYVHGLGRAK